MKIKVNQLDRTTRRTVAIALELYAYHVSEIDPGTMEKYRNMAIAVRNGELLLCEYVSNGEEE